MLESLSLDGMPDQLNKHLNKQKEFIHGLVELLKESPNDMPAELNVTKGWSRDDVLQNE